MFYYTKLTVLNEKQQSKFGCKYIVQVREKNPTTGYLFPEEILRKFQSYKEARKFQLKLQNASILN